VASRAPGARLTRNLWADWWLRLLTWCIWFGGSSLVAGGDGRPPRSESEREKSRWCGVGVAGGVRVLVLVRGLLGLWVRRWRWDLGLD